jgi:hypothetical protein
MWLVEIWHRPPGDGTRGIAYFRAHVASVRPNLVGDMCQEISIAWPDEEITLEITAMRP